MSCTSAGSFTVLTEDPATGARVGRLLTAHGAVETPAFMPVASAGVVKGITPAELREVGVEMVLANAYHLWLRPGIDLVAEMGGLHRFMGWGGPLLTDSGGFQVFSLAPLRRLHPDGIEFRSHLDGARRFLRPEDAVGAQERLGADVAMMLDPCLGPDVSREEAAGAVELGTVWAERALEVRSRPETALYGIVHGGLFPDLRARSAEALVELGFDGYAAGGLSVGEPRAQTLDLASETVRRLPRERPRYLMGVGRPAELVEFVALGYDLFDCVVPTRNGRNGWIYTRQGRIAIRNASYREDDGPLEPGCECFVCKTMSRAYLRHLFMLGDPLAGRAATYHNLRFYLRLMEEIRDGIRAGCFRQMLAEWRGSARPAQVAG